MVHPDQHRVVGGGQLATIEGSHLLVDGGEGGQLVVDGTIAVGDVVDAPGEGVQRRHRVALRARQQRDAVGEVLRLRLGDLGALGVRGLDVHRRLPGRSRTMARRSTPSLGRTAAPCEHVVVGGDDRVECGVTARHEAGDGDAGLHRQRGDEVAARVEQQARPVDLERHEPAHVAVGERSGEVVVGAPELGEVLLGQVHPPGGVVLGDVLEVLDDLEPAADVVGPAQHVVAADAERAEHQTADRVGRQAAVVEQVVEREVADLLLVAAVGRDQVAEQGERLRVGTQDRRETGDGGVCGPPDHGRDEIRFQPVERGQPVTGVFVADVVGQAGEAVDGEQGGAHTRRQEARGNREVLCTGLDPESIRTWEVGGHRARSSNQ